MKKKLLSKLLVCTLALQTAFASTVSMPANTKKVSAALTGKSPFTNSTYTHNDTFSGYNIYHGIDVSKYNNNNGTIDWNKVKKAGVDFVIVRVGYRGYGKSGTLCTDPFYKTNIEGALAAGIKVGVYYFTEALTTSEAKEEAKFCIDKIKDYDITLPVAIDYEYPTDGSKPVGRMYNAKLSKSAATANVKAFCAAVKAESSEKTFNYLYYPWELHFPLLCGFHRKKPVPMGFKDVGIVDMSEFIEGQLADCLDYVNLQLDYFKNIVADNGYTVIFSDHSQIVYDEEKCVPFFDYYNYPDRSTHCVMAIKGPGIEHKEYDEVASLVDFNRIFKDFIWERNYKLPERKIAQFQYYSTHNKAFRDVAEEKGLTDYIDGIAGFISKDYLYAVTNTGVKEVYRMGNHRDNIIDTPEGMAYAEEINNNYKIEFPKFLKLTY